MQSAALKSDLFGSVRLQPMAGYPVSVVVRETVSARRGLGWLARRLAAREARALAQLAAVDGGIPRLLRWDGTVLVRSWLAGDPMQRAQPTDPAYFRDALRLLRRVHAAGVIHNDLAKEPNWLVLPDGRAGLVDFQLAMVPRRRNALMRSLAQDDLRHLLKHKRTYCPQALTSRQRRLLDQRSLPSQFWMRTGKPVYRFVTRRLFGWADREGAGDRQSGTRLGP